jgi:hypothetical protein
MSLKADPSATEDLHAPFVCGELLFSCIMMGFAVSSHLPLHPLSLPPSITRSTDFYNFLFSSVLHSSEPIGHVVTRTGRTLWNSTDECQAGSPYPKLDSHRARFLRQWAEPLWQKQIAARQQERSQGVERSNMNEKTRGSEFWKTSQSERRTT